MKPSLKSIYIEETFVFFLLQEFKAPIVVEVLLQDFYLLLRKELNSNCLLYTFGNSLNIGENQYRSHVYYYFSNILNH